jgi:16S rRNA (guanine966-N2)-methyltransferase
MSMRILAGRFKGREILTPRGRQVRPMTGLVRKSLLDILAPRLEGAAVADLYCGTGTLGLEALSRGAGRAFFAERDRRTVLLLRRNLQAFGVEDCCRVWEGDLTARLARWLEECGSAIDIAFVDPPYADARSWDWSQAVSDIFEPLARHLAPEGVVALRLPGGVEPPAALGPLAVAREKRYGDMTVLLLERGGEEKKKRTTTDSTDSGITQIGEEREAEQQRGQAHEVR